ncbi:hypothetical protein J132_08112 [Termitomyces sp. J132]|nr:hypothetical protein J132_08112 [Termitomyces sp. J132]
MATTITNNRNEETIALSAVNSLFLAGFAFCITSALLAFLTARWLQCLTMQERSYFEYAFEAEERQRSQRLHPLGRFRDVEQGIIARPSLERCQPLSKEDENVLHTPKLIHFFFAYTLFVPMSLLVIGFLCLSIGLLVFAWTEHSLAVGIVLTVVYLILLPFSVGVFLIGQRPHTRFAVIRALAKHEGNF